MAKQAGRSVPPSRSGGNLVLGIFIGLLLGLAIALVIAFYLSKTPIPFLGGGKPGAKDAKSAQLEPPKVAGMPQSGTPAAKAPDKPKFDFYKILPGGEEPVSEKELKDATAKA